MKDQPFRLGARDPHPFVGSRIDRQQPLAFRLDGRTIHGFVGDSVLSAVLAAGIDSVGLHQQAPLALDDQTGPGVLPRRTADAEEALPMRLVKAVDGADLKTINGPRWSTRSFRLPGRRGRSLQHRLEQFPPRPRWTEFEPGDRLEADVVVVGGGVAGMSAALAAAEDGDRVVLIEKQFWLGGAAPMFGAVDNEEKAEAMVTRLSEAIGRHDGVSVLNGTEALHLSETQVDVLRPRPGHPAIGTVVRVVGKRVVLATGAVECLPIFPGNRLPGVATSLWAYQLARQFGVWPGTETIVSTGSGVAYRLAMLARDAGIAVGRIADARLEPQSRFIEFSKAYGIPLSTALRPAAATAAQHARLAVTFESSVEGIAATTTIEATRLIVCGGWQPNLALWLMAGGDGVWDRERDGFIPSGHIPHVALAGAAAGLLTTAACARSGAEAVAGLFGRTHEQVSETLIDPIYETPDAPTPVSLAAVADNAAPAYLDASETLAFRRSMPKSRPRRNKVSPVFDGRRGILSFSDIAAAVRLGAVAPVDAAVIARERSLADSSLAVAPTPIPAIDDAVRLRPDYLAGRFGDQPSLWMIAADSPRQLGVGALLFPNSEASDPRLSIGVVVASSGATGEATALIAQAAGAGDRLVLRDLGRQVGVRVVAAAQPPAA